MNTEEKTVSVQSPEDFEDIVTSGSGFEGAVITAATEQAQTIIEAAKADGKKKYEDILFAENKDVVAAHKTEIEAALRRKVAGAKQDNMKKLLVYRKQLVNGLFAQCKEALQQFTSKEKEYVTFVLKSIEPHTCKVGEECVILHKQGDEKLAENIKKIIPNANCEVDKTIKIGGVKLKCKRVLYDETIDRRLQSERKNFLQHCQLHISAVETEPINE